MKNWEKVDSGRGKLLLATICLFVGIAVFINYSHNYSPIREESIDIKAYENVESVREIFRDINEIIGDSANNRIKSEIIEFIKRIKQNNWMHQKYRKMLCDLEKTSIDKLRKFNFSVNQP